MIALSILGIKENIDDNYKQVDNSTADYIHIDIMDSIFVKNKNDFDINYNFNKKLDIHLMVVDIIKYIDFYKKLNPEFITFHLEAAANPLEIINYIKSLNIKVGISIKPSTSLETLFPYLDLVDLILIMSVEPGLGGQEFIEETSDKINKLIEIRKNNSFLIEVDGGINDLTYSKVKQADIFVVGSFITNSSNYQSQIDKLK